MPGASGEDSVVVSVSVTDRTDRVYNFTVANTHTYFVGDTNVWVHNGECEETVKIFKAPSRNQDPQRWVEEGFSKNDFPGPGKSPGESVPDGFAYFSRDESVAQGFSKHYENGVVRIDVPKSVFDEKFAPSERPLQIGFETTTEVPITNDSVEILNSFPITWYSYL